MPSTQRLTGTLAGGGGLVIGFLTGRWLAGRLRTNSGSDIGAVSTRSSIPAAN
jgi:hypothetical protein